MKKTLLTPAILIVISLQTFSQSVTNTPYLGLKAAANFSTNSFRDPSLTDYNVKYNTGFAGGLYYNIPVAHRFSIQPELLYSQLGSKLESTLDASQNITMQIEYISMPLLIKFSPINHFAVFAGPELMFMTSAKLNYESANDDDIMNALQNFDPAATIGLEYWFTKNIGIYGRYIFGLSNLNQADPGLWMNQQFVTSNISNSALQVGIAIGFPGSESTFSSESSGSSAPSDNNAPSDRDGDGVSDKEDRCPDKPGTVDNLGCPDMILYYGHDDDILDSADKANLDRVVTFMKENSHVKIIIEGYSNAQGDSAYNQTLSEKRAKASLDYIASKGVSDKRMETIGYGERYPIGDNSTDEGRAKNRRVVIRVTK